MLRTWLKARRAGRLRVWERVSRTGIIVRVRGRSGGKRRMWDHRCLRWHLPEVLPRWPFPVSLLISISASTKTVAALQSNKRKGNKARAWRFFHFVHPTPLLRCNILALTGSRLTVYTFEVPKKRERSIKIQTDGEEIEEREWEALAMQAMINIKKERGESTVAWMAPWHVWDLLYCRRPGPRLLICPLHHNYAC